MRKFSSIYKVAKSFDLVFKIKEYLKTKKGIQPTKEELIKSMKGVAYTNSPSGYTLNVNE